MAKKTKRSLTSGQKVAKTRMKRKAAKKTAAKKATKTRKKKTAAKKAVQTKKWNQVVDSATHALQALDSGDENACRQHLAAIIKTALK